MSLTQAQSEKRRVLGTKQAGEFLGISRDTVSRLCRMHLFPNATQDAEGHPWHIPFEDVELYKRNKSKQERS